MENPTNAAQSDSGTEAGTTLLGSPAPEASSTQPDTSTEGGQTTAADEGTSATGDDVQQSTSEANTDSQPSEGAPEQYESFTAPEGTNLSDDVLSTYSEAAKELNLSQEQAQSFIDKLAPAIAEQQKAQVDAIREEWINASKNDKDFGGEKFNENLAVAKRAIEKFGTPELMQLLNETGLGNNPELIRMLVNAGRTLKEDTFVDGKRETTGSTGPTTFAQAAKKLYG